MFMHDPKHTGRSPYNGVWSPRLKWKLKTGHPSSPAIGSDGTIYIGSSSGYLHAIGNLLPTITCMLSNNSITFGENVKIYGVISPPISMNLSILYSADEKNLENINNYY